MFGLLAKKIGMMHVFDEKGDMHPATVLLAGPNVIIQKKTAEKDGYAAVQIGFDEVPMKKASKPMKGHFQAAKLQNAYRFIREIRNMDVASMEVGQTIKVDIFKKGDRVDVAGVSKGKGFQGVMRRHHFRGGAGSHGSMFHRAPGSIGSSSDPSRVFKGLRMAGHMGDHQVTTQNLEVIKVDAERQLILIRGAVPGARNGYLTVLETVKKKLKVRQEIIGKIKLVENKPQRETKKEKK